MTVTVDSRFRGNDRKKTGMTEGEGNDKKKQRVLDLQSSWG